jgi:amino acid adenylation domain-containing protein
VSDVRALLAAKLANRNSGIPRRPDPAAPAPLSPMQAALWFGWQYDPGSAAYHLPLVLTLTGAVDPADVAGAVRDLAARHEVLRSVVEVRDGEPVMVVRPADDVPVSIEVPGGPLPGLLAAEATRPFALDAEPPLRATVFTPGDGRVVLALTVHHIATDGWSQDVLLRDLRRLYAARAGLGEAPEPPALQYADVAAWQAGRRTEEWLAPRLAWWSDTLAGLPGALELPTDRPEPAGPRWESGVAELTVPAELADRIRAAAAGAGGSAFMVLLAGLQALLSRLAGTDDVLVGVPSAGREHPDTEQVVGCFLDVLLVRGDLSGDPTGAELLERAREAVLGAFGHAGVPMERILDQVRPQRRPGAPLYQVQLNVHGAAAPVDDLPGVGLAADYTLPGSAKFDLNVHLADPGPGGALSGAIEYRRDLWDLATVERLAHWYVTLLSGLVAAPGVPVAALPLEPVTGPLLAGPVEARDERPLHARVAGWADRTPRAPAVTGPDGTLTYGQLDRRANAIAARLRAAGVGRGDVVGVRLDPSAAYPAAVLGVLAAGAAYLPVDPAFPVARATAMLAHAVAVLSTEDIPWSPVPVLPVDDAESGERIDPGTGADDLLHVIFTSGSTGTPKGSMVTHRGVANCMDGWSAVPGGAYAVVSTLAADLGLAGFWGALLSGGTLHLLDRETATDPAAYAAYLAAHPVDVVKMVPSHLTLLATHGADLAAVLPRTLLVLGGEACPWTLVERVRAASPALRVHTHYGPTESSMFSMVCDVDEVPADARTGAVPLGTVLPNIGVHVLDRAGRPLPAGIPGELALVGPGVSRGYAGDPDRTAERFVADPAGGPGRCYRTGDLVRVRPDGVVLFLGRTDDQVKVRGHRVELGEVVAACRAVPGVADAVVLPDGEGHERRLVGWLVPQLGVPLDAAAVRAALRERLPDHLVPAALVLLDRLPLTANGKVDRAALPRPGAGDERPRSVVPPRTPTERAIAAVWAEVLGVAEIGAGDDFFGLGGHSFAATRAVGRLRDALGVDLPLRMLFDHPVLADLASTVDGLGESTVDAPAPPARVLRRPDPDAPAPLSPAQAYWWLMSQLHPDSAVATVPAVLRLTGPLDGAALLAAARDVADRHPVLRSAVRTVDGQPVAVPLPAAAVEVSARAVDPADLDAAVRAATTRPYALETEPPMRVQLLELGGDRRVLVLTVHHLATDAWSMELLLADLAACYAARLGLVPPPPLPALDYADHAARAATEDPDAGLDWWAGTLADLPVLDLGLGHRSAPDPDGPPASPTRAAGVLPLTVPAPRVRAVAAATGSTPFMVLLAGWQALLSRLSGSPDVPVGVAVSGRDHPDTDGVLGCFANTLVLRTAVDPALTGRQLLGRVKDVALDALAHGGTPFGRVAQRLHPEQGSRTGPLFQAMLNFIDAGGELPPFAGVTVDGYERPVDDVDLDLTLTLVDRGGDYRGSLSYRADLLDGAAAARVAGWYAAVLDGLLADPDAPLSSVELVPADERARLLALGTGAPLPADAPATVVEAVLARAADRPSAVAVTGPAGELSYGDLAALSARIAAGLLAAGAAAGVPIGVCVPRDELLPAALLAVWRAGAPYLPLDAEHPAERLRRLCADAGTTLVLTRGATGAVTIPGVTTLDVDALIAAAGGEPVLPAVRPEDLAYVLHTSGSTGTPKGVEITQANLAGQVAGYAVTPGLRAEDVMLAAAPITFDQGGEEIWAPLATGARCVVVERDLVLDGYGLAERINAAGITIADLSVPLARLLLAAGWRPEPTLRVWVGTEAPDQALVRALLPQVAELWNTYGPTEATIQCVAHRITAADTGTVPIGRPLPGNTAYVVDAAGRLAPAGVTGELWVGGVGVAAGYRDRPEATAAAFVEDPWGPGRCYRTGDLARWTQDGGIEFAGRRDWQVKVRGHRIELGEIEGGLHEHPGLDRAAAAVHGGVLVGYVSPSTVDTAAVEAGLRERLPDYLVPRRWVALDRLPLLDSGKVDRRALPAPGPDAGRPRVPLSTDSEHLAAAAWSEVLGVADVHASDDFFALGGHSFAAVRVVGRLRDALGVPVPARLLFDNPCLADFAAELERMLLALLAEEA